MASVNPTRAQIEQFELDTPDDQPIVMVNLLRFRETADYGRATLTAAVSGRSAYSRYSKAVMPLLWEVGGEPLWMGRVRVGVIAPADEAWDEVLLVYYPSRRAFLRMVKSDAYQAHLPHRTAALADSRLLETRAVSLPRWLLRGARALHRLKALVKPSLRG